MKIKRQYTILPEQNGERWSVIEEPTSQTIKRYESVVEAQALCDRLNAGGAFAGNTPAFFLIPLEYRGESNT